MNVRRTPPRARLVAQLSAVLISVATLTACTADTDDARVDEATSTTTSDSGRGAGAGGRGPGGPTRVDTDGVTEIPGSDLDARLDEIPTAELTEEEIDGLVWMREEETLARDVYTVLGEEWPVRAFDNIAAAEQTHTDAVETLLDRYAIPDPDTATTGEFTNPEIQALYTTLVDEGLTSQVAALTVGAEIEELDIVDLRERATETPDIALVYANLEKGSRNHLRAFTSQLERAGVTYAPSHLSQADYEAIVTGDMERGSAD